MCLALFWQRLEVPGGHHGDEFGTWRPSYRCGPCPGPPARYQPGRSQSGTGQGGGPGIHGRRGCYGGTA